MMKRRGNYTNSPTALSHCLAGKRREDLAYQAATVASILMLLGSLWAF